MTEPDAAVVTTVVDVDARTAFDVFTGEIGLWWGSQRPRNRFRRARDDGSLWLEPGVGGRLLEVYEDGSEPFHVGTISVWEPARRLVFDWRQEDFAQGERTVVEVRFEERHGRTRITLEHRGFAALAPDHPARHGLRGPDFRNLLGVFWADQLVRFGARLRVPTPG